MFFLILTIIFTVSASITAFLVATSDLNEIFKKMAFPIITEYGHIIDSKEQLDENLDNLKYMLEEKRGVLDDIRQKICAAERAMDRLNSNSAEIKRYYMQLRSEVLKKEMECTNLTQQITSYMKRQRDLQDALDMEYIEELPHPEGSPEHCYSI